MSVASAVNGTNPQSTRELSWEPGATRMTSSRQISQSDIILATDDLSRVVGAVMLVNDVTVELRRCKNENRFLC